MIFFFIYTNAFNSVWCNLYGYFLFYRSKTIIRKKNLSEKKPTMVNICSSLLWSFPLSFAYHLSCSLYFFLLLFWRKKLEFLRLCCLCLLFVLISNTKKRWVNINLSRLCNLPPFRLSGNVDAITFAVEKVHSQFLMFKDANEAFCLFCAWRCYARKQKEVSRISSTDSFYHVKIYDRFDCQELRKSYMENI